MYITKAKNQPEWTRQSDLVAIANGILYKKYFITNFTVLLTTNVQTGKRFLKMQIVFSINGCLFKGNAYFSKKNS